MSSDTRPDNRLESASSTLRRYGVALASVAVCAFAWFALDLLFKSTAPLLVFVPAVLIASAFGGLGPGLLATGLSLATSLSFDPSLATGQPITHRHFHDRQRWHRLLGRSGSTAAGKPRPAPHASCSPRPKTCARAKLT